MKGTLMGYQERDKKLAKRKEKSRLDGAMRTKTRRKSQDDIQKHKRAAKDLEKELDKVFDKESDQGNY
tara:strand:- start:268 stop:471 length:204 start_codon:yes stop_codon:yes gene_type:complete